MLMRAVPRPVAGLSLAIVLTVAAACGSNPKVQKAPVAPAESAPPPAEVPPPPPPPDPISALIQTSQDHFVAGERELKLGHLERARIEFDRAVDVLLESPYGARTDARMREHFDRLIDRINAHEVTALAQGDGFSETKTEPASIDEILAIATFLLIRNMNQRLRKLPERFPSQAEDKEGTPPHAERRAGDPS